MDMQPEPSAGGVGHAGSAHRRGTDSTQRAPNKATMDHLGEAICTEISCQEGLSSAGTYQATCDCPLTQDDSSSANPSPLPSARKPTDTTVAANGAPPICTAPSVSPVRPGWPLPHSPKNNGTVRPDKRRLPSTANSQHSLKSTASQIQQVAGDDCCVHCILACLFCELLSLCSVLTQCLACGRSCEALCCCEGGATGGMVCGEESCSTALDCGMLEDCCESSDCLEICLECCSICFPT